MAPPDSPRIPHGKVTTWLRPIKTPCQRAILTGKQRASTPLSRTKVPLARANTGKWAGGENLSPIVCFLGVHRHWQGVMPGVGGPGRRREGVFCLVGGARSPCAECIPHGFPTLRPGWSAWIGGDPESPVFRPLAYATARHGGFVVGNAFIQARFVDRARCPSRRGRRLRQAQLSGRAGTARMGALARVSNLVLARRRSVTVTRSSTSRAW